MVSIPRPRSERDTVKFISAETLIAPEVLDRLAADPEPPTLHIRPMDRAWVLDICCSRLYLSDRLHISELSGAVADALDVLALRDLETGFHPEADALVAAVFG